LNSAHGLDVSIPRACGDEWDHQPVVGQARVNSEFASEASQNRIHAAAVAAYDTASAMGEDCLSNAR